MRLSIDHRIAGGFFGALLALAILGSTSYWSARRAIDDEIRVETNQQTLRGMEEIVSSVERAASGAYAYALTGREEYRMSYEESIFAASSRSYAVWGQLDADPR